MIFAREAVFLALMRSAKNEQFIADSLDVWIKEFEPSHSDALLARQIAFGTCQRALTLDYLALKLAERQKLSLKLKEKLILRMALYQYYFLARIPLYAIVDESVKLAKKYCHRIFANFLNGALRKLSQHPLSLPEEDSVDSWVIRYSFPAYYVKALVEEVGLERAKEIFALQNEPSAVMLRLRGVDRSAFSELPQVLEEPPVALLNDLSKMDDVVRSSCYIQNVTPAYLMWKLAQGVKHRPSKILDLCASPGGKLIALYDLFPKAVFVANDVTAEKVERLRENCAKYQVSAEIFCSDGKGFNSDLRFDLIVLDVPCSNTGVLNKRAEARWRLSEEGVALLAKEQMGLVRQAVKLLAPGGELWYMTCSILREENEKMVVRACGELGLQVRWQELLLPNKEGWDGGFCAALVSEK